MTEKRITTFQAGIIFSTSVVLFLGFALLNPFEDFYVTGVTVEVIALLLPALAGLLIFRKSFRLNLKLKPPGWINSLMVVFITLFSLPVTLALSALNLWLVESVFGESRIPEVPIPETVPQLLLSLAVVALVPAVCEEILHRGIFQSAFEKFGKWPCVLMVSVLFTLFHFSFEKLLGIFFLSVVIGYVVYVTKSIFIGMIAHFVNNAAAMVISYAATRIGGSEWMYESTELMVEGFEVFQTIVSVVFIGAIVIGAASLTIGLMTVLTRRNRTEEEVLPRPRFMPADVFTFIPGLLLMAGIYSVTFLAMLFSQFLP